MYELDLVTSEFARLHALGNYSLKAIVSLCIKRLYIYQQFFWPAYVPLDPQPTLRKRIARHIGDTDLSNHGNVGDCIEFGVEISGHREA